jgi:hypothetical protein
LTLGVSCTDRQRSHRSAEACPASDRVTMGVAAREERGMVEEAKEVYEKGKEAFEFGYGIGEKINEVTGASDVLSDAAVAANPERAYSASQDWDEATSEWDKGEYGSAVADGASAVGKFALSTGEAAVDAVGDAASAVGDAIFGGPSMMDVLEEARKRAEAEAGN